MPAIAKGSKVLVTGANGYIAIWVVRTLLEAGYAVRGTVRSQDKGAYLTDKFKAFGDKFEFVIVKDIAEDNAFDEAVKGVDAVAHTASPFHFDAEDPQVLIRPAVKGTTGILHSIIKNGSAVKRVIVLSSCAAVSELHRDKIFDENDWNEQSIIDVNEQGPKTFAPTKYRASKTLAEKAAWEIYNQHKGKVSWDLTVLNPPFVFGPTLHDVPSPSALNTSSKQMYNAILVEGSFTPEALATQGSSYVDVRDLAEAHVRSFEREEAGGERIIISARTYVWQDFVDAANVLSPPPLGADRKLVRGTPGAGKTAKPPVRYNTEKEARILGLKYRGVEELVRDCLVDFRERGW